MSKHIDMEEQKMHGFRAWLDYQLKHNDTFYSFFQTTVSFGMRVIGFFVPIDKKMILFSAHSRKYNDSPKTIYEYMIANPAYKDYKYLKVSTGIILSGSSSLWWLVMVSFRSVSWVLMK